MVGSVIVKKETLKKELDRIYKKIPSVVCDVPSLMWVIQTLEHQFKKDFEEGEKQNETT